jgi:hypothetical protein
MRMGRKMRAPRVDSGAVSVDQDDHHETQLEQQNTAITPSNR